MSAVADISAIIGLAVILLVFTRLIIRYAHNKLGSDIKTLEGQQQEREKHQTQHEYEFYRKYGYSWDWVIVFPVHDEHSKLTEFQKNYSMKRVISFLANGGLETKLFYSVQRDEIYCKVRCPFERLRKEADRIDYKLLFNEDRLQGYCEHGTGNWKGLKIEDHHGQSSYRPYQYIYGKFEDDRPELYPLYNTYDNQIFRGVDRLKLILSIIEARQHEGGSQLDINQLEKEQAFLAIYPLHDRRELYRLQAKWISFSQWPWHQPCDDVKNYFGEKIGLYFVWLGHYTTWLLIPSIIGIGCWINVAINSNNPDSVSVPYFAASMAMWTTVYLEFWKRNEHETGMKWGMKGFEEEEQDRPQFVGQMAPSPIDGSTMLYFPRKEKLKRFAISQAVIVMMIAIVVVAVAFLFVFKDFIASGDRNEKLRYFDYEFASIIGSIANAIQIQILNALYGAVALKMTELENHRTDTAYEDSLITKTFLFQFVNSYSSLFYIAFIKPFFVKDQHCVISCMSELQTNLGTIFLTRLATGNLTEMFVPIIKARAKRRKETEGSDPERQPSDCEWEYFAEEYDELLGTFNDYAEMVIQYGYSTLFVAAFPLAPLMSFVNNYIELRVDAWKLCQLTRRPIPSGAEDIGSWFSVLEIMSTIAVIINGGLIFFTGTQFKQYTWVWRVWYFVIFEHTIILLKFALALIVPDVPRSVEIQLSRQEFIPTKVIEDIADDDFDITDLEDTQMNLRISMVDEDVVA